MSIEEKIVDSIEDPLANITAGVFLANDVLRFFSEQSEIIEKVHNILFWTFLLLSIFFEIIACVSKKSVEERYSPGFIRFGRYVFLLGSIILVVDLAIAVLGVFI